MRRGAARRFGRDVLAGLIGFGVIFLAVYATGKAFEPPGAEAALAQLDAGTYSMEVTDSDSTLMAVLRAELAGLDQPSAAIVAVSGAIEERRVLGFADLRSCSWCYYSANDLPPEPPSEKDPLDLSIKYSGSQAALSLAVRGALVGVPQTEDMDVTLSVGPKSWFAHGDDCTLELVHLEWTVMSPPAPAVAGRPATEILFPDFLGVVSCDQVDEVRSGEIASFSAVFIFGPEG